MKSAQIIASLTLLLTLVALASCTESPEQRLASISPSASGETQQAAKSITWFDGSVNAAFAKAKQESKPLFLYWGAVWCPPCQEIKQTVFKSRRFIEQTSAFIPVYLDGDTDAAQTVGEQYGVKGYPTMIVFNSEGNEITRIPGGIDITKYNDILAASLESITPTRELVARLTTGSPNLSESELKQLAYYSWGQDHNALPENYDPDLFLTASNLAIDPVISSRLYMQYLSAVSDTRQPDSRELVSGMKDRLSEILGSKALVLANWDSLAYYSTDLAPLAAIGDELAALKTQWQEALFVARHDESLSVAEQLGGLLPTIAFYFEDESKTALDPQLEAVVLADTSQADRATQNAFARQSVANQLSYVLQQAKLMDQAKALLTSELERSESPYYFMSSLAAIAEDEDDTATALTWRKKAYETAVGSATRFQWGASYVRALMRLTPNDEATVTSVSMALFNEMNSDTELFAGRNFRVLRSLHKALHEWQEARSATSLVEFDAAIIKRCATLSQDSQAATNCKSLTTTSLKLI